MPKTQRLNSSPHGGACCGITHIHEFAHGPIAGYVGGQWKNFSKDEHQMVCRESLVNAINEAIDELLPDPDDYCDCDCGECETYPNINGSDFSRLFEAVLNQHQYEQFEPLLLDFGFKMVTEFHNSNSGNQCRVYHFVAPGVMS